MPIFSNTLEKVPKSPAQDRSLLYGRKRFQYGRVFPAVSEGLRARGRGHVLPVIERSRFRLKDSGRACLTLPTAAVEVEDPEATGPQNKTGCVGLECG